MKSVRLALLAAAIAVLGICGAEAQGALMMGAAAMGDWKSDAPGVRRLITATDIPQPYATRSAGNPPRLVQRPPDAKPIVPDGFNVDLFASGLDRPRVIRVAPNGDIFVAESGAGRVIVFRAADGAAKPSKAGVFASGLGYPYGIAFYPLGSDPQWVYVGETDRVVRFPYRSGDLVAGGEPQTVVARLPTGGHVTRDIAFSQDGKRLLVAVGSASNVAEGQQRLSASAIAAWEAAHGLGASWGREEDRADVLSFDPDGGNKRTFATGIRNCAGLAVEPNSGTVWCATNERDGLGDNLPPDYVSRIREGAFYGWPWYYIGDNQDPRHAGERPDLKGEVTISDVLIQAHSAPLGLTFYTGDAFPAEYHGDGFATLHGSWNRTKRTGYKVVRIAMKDGVPTGEYEDFMTGMVISDNAVWGRPVGIAMAHDGALLVSEDGNGTIWRVTAAK
jgi:glucose/arabinose dehydrogenase